MPQATIITTAALSVGYRHGRKTAAVLSGLNLELRRGELVSLLGSNGMGKSTLLRTLTGSQPPLAGEITIDGTPLRRLSARQLAKTVAIVYTDHTRAGALTVTELVALGRQPYTGFFGRLDSDDREIVADAIARTGISHKADTPLARLSDGERQKAMIAKALAQATPVIIMDEPTAFLDAASRIETMALLHTLSREQDKAILLSTHDVAPAMALSDRLWVVNADGEMVSGTPERLALAGDGLAGLFDRRPVEFDPMAGDFRGLIGHKAAVTLRCADPVTARWIANALRREGIAVEPGAARVMEAASIDDITLDGLTHADLPAAVAAILGRQRPI